MGLLDSIANKLSVMAARRRLDSGTVANPYFMSSRETRDAVATLQRLGTREDKWRADRFDDIRSNGLDVGREINRMGVG